MLHSLPIFLLVKWMVLRDQGKHLVLPSRVLEKHLLTTYRHIKSLHASARWSLRPQKPLDIRDVQKHGARQQRLWPSCISFLDRPAQQRSDIFIPGSPSGQQWKRRYTTEKHLQSLALGLIHHPAEKEKPGSSLVQHRLEKLFTRSSQTCSVNTESQIIPCLWLLLHCWLRQPGLMC